MVFWFYVVFLKSWITQDGIGSDDLDTFREAILSGCDTNNDGKVDKKELTMILLALNKELEWPVVHAADH